MTYDPSGRFQLVPQGQLINPGQCAVCNTDRSEKGFVSPQLTFEFYGELYFCEFCAVGMAEAFLAIPHNAAEQLRGTLAEWKKSHGELRGENVMLVKENHELRSAFNALNGTAPSEYVSDESDLPEPSESEDGNGIAGVADDNVEPHEVDGPDDVSPTPISHRRSTSSLSL
jgi:hypothetical protein